MSSTTSRSIFESSNSGRIRRPRGGDSLDFSKSFEFGGSNHQYHQSLNREGRRGATDDFATSIAVVQKHSCKLDYQDKFLVLKHSSLTVSCVCFSRTSLVLSHRGWLPEKYEKLQEQSVSLSDEWGPVSLECCLKLPPYTIQP